MTDLPQHAAQVALLRAMYTEEFPFASLFQVDWFTPYLLAHLMVYSLVPLLGMVGALKLVTACAIAAVPCAATLVMSETGTDRRWALLVIPGMYGFSYEWGFLSFIVAAPLGFYLVALALRQARKPTSRRALGLALMTLALFFAHALVCAFFGAIAALVLASTAPSPASALRRVLPLTTVLPIALLWTSLLSDHPIGGAPIKWIPGWYRLAGSISWIFGNSSSSMAPWVALVILVLPLAAGGTIRAGRVWIPLLVCAATLALAPSEALGTAYVFHRFAWFMLPFYLLIFEAPRREWPRWTWAACVVVVSVWIGVIALRFRQYERESAPFASILAVMAPGQRALWLPIEPFSAFADAPPYLHFGSWYTALNAGLADPSMASAHTTAVRYRPESQPAIRPTEFELHPETFDWVRMGGRSYRYFFARSSTDPEALISRNAACVIRLVSRVDWWWLYEQDPACTTAPRRSSVH